MTTSAHRRYGISVGVANRMSVTSMALYRYFRPADGVLDYKGLLLSAIAPSVLAVVNKQVRSVASAQTQKRGSYLFFISEEKARVAQYTGVHGVRAAIRQFSSELRKAQTQESIEYFSTPRSISSYKARGSEGRG